MKRGEVVSPGLTGESERFNDTNKSGFRTGPSR